MDAGSREAQKMYLINRVGKEHRGVLQCNELSVTDRKGQTPIAGKILAPAPSVLLCS